MANNHSDQSANILDRFRTHPKSCISQINTCNDVTTDIKNTLIVFISKFDSLMKIDKSFMNKTCIQNVAKLVNLLVNKNCPIDFSDTEISAMHEALAKIDPAHYNTLIVPIHSLIFNSMRRRLQICNNPSNSLLNHSILNHSTENHSRHIDEPTHVKLPPVRNNQPIYGKTPVTNPEPIYTKSPTTLKSSDHSIYNEPIHVPAPIGQQPLYNQPIHVPSTQPLYNQPLSVADPVWKRISPARSQASFY